MIVERREASWVTTLCCKLIQKCMRRERKECSDIDIEVNVVAIFPPANDLVQQQLCQVTSMKTGLFQLIFPPTTYLLNNNEAGEKGSYCSPNSCNKTFTPADMVRLN